MTEAVTTRRLEQVVEVDAHEGPVYVAGEHALYFTSLPRGLRVDIRRLDLETGEVTTVREDANMANGMTLLPDGRLLVCEQGTMLEPARLSAFDLETAETEPIVEGWRGNALNSPNDVVVAPDGAIWFTDPSYGFVQGFRPQPQSGDYVYRHDPAAGETTVVADSFDKPNGLALSPDGSVLYVGDSGANHEVGTYDPTRPHHVIAFDVCGGRRLEHARLFAVVTPGFPDGIKVARGGCVYVSAFNGIQVFTPEGRLADEIDLPGTVNFAFDDHERTLFIATDTAVWAAEVDPAR